MARRKGSKNKKQRKNIKSPKKQKSIGKPFPPGVSGNKLGRPKSGESLTEILRKIGETYEKNTRQGKVLYKQALAEKVWELALKGKPWAVEMAFDRLDGRAMARAELSGPGGGPIEVVNLTASERQARVDKLIAARQALIDAKHS